MANKDLTISMVGDKRRIYDVEDAVNYLIPDTDWSAGVNFNVLKTEPKMNGTWQRYDVKTASPSKATAYIGWTPGPWGLRMQSTTSSNVSGAQGYRVSGYTAAGLLSSYQLPVDTLSFSIGNLFNRDYATAQGQRASLYYSPDYDPASLYDYEGRGRTFGLNYSVLF